LVDRDIAVCHIAHCPLIAARSGNDAKKDARPTQIPIARCPDCSVGEVDDCRLPFAICWLILVLSFHSREQKQEVVNNPESWVECDHERSGAA
jgi:hypothetical protein